MKKVAIMQPYFLPYIGYWQLIHSVDQFVIYDNIQYTKKGWINRNRFLCNEKDELFSLPLKKDKEYLSVNERFLAEDFNKKKFLAKISAAYIKAPYYKDIYPIVESIVNFDKDNLFDFIHNSVCIMHEVLNMKTEIIVSSTIACDHTLKAENKVLEICKNLNADTYINAIGGLELYNKEKFKENGMDLKFIVTEPVEYKQFGNTFIGSLSILDVLMFNNKDEVQEILNKYNLI